MNSVTINCSLRDCKYNDRGYCDKDDIFISDAETGDPICQDFEEGE